MNSPFNPVLAGMFGGWEVILLLAVVLLLFGAKKLPELAKGLGKSIKEFKKASNEDEEIEVKATQKSVEAAKTDSTTTKTHGSN